MAREMAQWLRASVSLEEDLGSVPSTCMADHNTLIPVPENPVLWALHSGYTCRQNTHVLK